MKPVEFEVGQLWSTTTGRTVEIVAVDEVEAEDGFGFPIEGAVRVIAYRYAGGSVIHLRTPSMASGWQKINEG